MKFLLFLGVLPFLVIFSKNNQETKKINPEFITDGDSTKIHKTLKQWKMELSDEEYRITREKGTERPFTGKYWDNHEKGIYNCVCCGSPLFDSNTKFDSGTGWPSFYDVIESGNVGKIEDVSLGMKRVEVVCKKCDAHLGHVFDDGPKPSGLRYCINSAALKFEKK